MNVENNKNTTTSPLFELSDKDHGDEIQRRFRYQHTVAAYIAILMYSGNVEYKEILCEHHEDVTGILDSGKLHGIQIKTRQLSDGPFKLSDDAVKSSIIRFIVNYKKYPGHFEKFVFIANCGYLINKTGDSIETLSQELKKVRPPSFKFSPSTLDKYIIDIEKESGATRQEIVEILRITDFQSMPGLNDIESKIITESLSKIALCSNYSVERLASILDKLIYTAYLASSKKSKEPIADYISLLRGDKIRNLVSLEVNAKRITKEMVASIIKSCDSKAYYLAAEDGAVYLNPNRKKLMELKMNYGMIDPDAISIIDSLRDRAEEYFLGNYYKDNGNNSVIKKFLHVREIVKNQAVEAKISNKSKKVVYGSDMLRDIENRLLFISQNRSKDVDDCPYEILKGLVGSLAGECQIQFSDTPEGGWEIE